MFEPLGVVEYDWAYFIEADQLVALKLIVSLVIEKELVTHLCIEMYYLVHQQQYLLDWLQFVLELNQCQEEKVKNSVYFLILLLNYTLILKY